MLFSVVQDKVKAETTYVSPWPFMHVKFTPGFYARDTGTHTLTYV